MDEIKTIEKMDSNLLRKALLKQGYITGHIWMKEDVEKIVGKEITQKNFEDFDEYLGRKVDCEIGLNWQSLEDYYQMFKKLNL